MNNPGQKETLNDIHPISRARKKSPSKRKNIPHERLPPRQHQPLQTSPSLCRWWNIIVIW